MIDRSQLRYFLAVVEAGNFSRAAAQVNITQPALSVAVAKLERSLGAKVFNRNNKRVELTDEGNRLLAHARSIEREFRELERTVPAPQRRPVVRMGFLSSIPTPVLEAVIQQHAEDGTACLLEVVEGSERDLLGRLQRRRLDLALTMVRSSPTQRQEPLFTEGFSLALPISHRLAAQTSIRGSDLASEVMIVRRHCEVLGETIRHFSEQDLRTRFSFRTTNDDKVLAMVRAGLGITVMPDSFRDPRVVRPNLIGFDCRRQIGILYATHVDPDDAGIKGLANAIRTATSKSV